MQEITVSQEKIHQVSKEQALVLSLARLYPFLRRPKPDAQTIMGQ
jgi:hypothetical protein